MDWQERKIRANQMLFVKTISTAFTDAAVIGLLFLYKQSVLLSAGI